MSAISYVSFQRDFRFQAHLGKGNYSTVNQVLHNVDHRSYAHKATQLSSIDDFVQCFNEIQTLKTIDDDHLAKLYYYYGNQNKQTGRFEIGLIMELCGASLSQVIRQRRRRNDYFSLPQVREFLCSMVCFFAKMQRKGYMHRDIKPDNILLSRCKQKYKIVDFGFAIKLNHYSTQNVAGTMEYVSPKLKVKFNDNSIMVAGHNFKDDVYSFGKTLLELMLLQTDAGKHINRIHECIARYGQELSTLVRLMTEVDENKRPDFVYLQKEMIRQGIIDVEGLNDSKETTISRSTVKDYILKRQESDPGKFTEDRSKSSVGNRRQKGDTKTKRKEVLQDTRSEMDHIKISPTNKKKIVCKKQVKQCKLSLIKFNESVCSMASYENIFFLGLQGKLGVMVGAGEKVLKLVIDKFSRQITVIKVSVNRKMLFFGALDGAFYMVAISQIKKLIADKNCLLIKKKEIEVPLSSVVFKVWHLPKPVLCICDCSTDEQAKEVVLILGHYSGEISVINESVATKTMTISFLNEPVTGIAYHSGYVYTSNTLGIFKKQPSICYGLTLKNESIQKSKALLCEQPQYYHCNSLIITFQIISDCKANQSISKVGNQYLALVPCCDGMLHIVSKSMRCQKMVRISQIQMITASFESVPNLPLSMRMICINQDGVVLDENGTVQQSSGVKKVNCMVSFERMLLLGSYEKTVTILHKKEAITIEEV